MYEPKAQVYIYRSLFLIFFASCALFVYNLFYGNSDLWQLYSKYYVASVVVYLWFLFFLLFRAEYVERSNNKQKAFTYNGERIAVIMPCYNEPPELLLKALQSVYRCNGNKEIIIVDDGSMNGIQENLGRIERFPGLEVHYLQVNKGKRHALHAAIKNLTADAKYIVTIDSDTVLDKDALIRIVEPLKRPGVGAASGDVRLLNEKQNLLTRMIGAYYWKSLNIQRKAQSGLGMVGCCSGCLASYRRDLMDSIIDLFLNQTFMGERCTYSEDRHLTNLVLKNGYKVVFEPSAISYTNTPHTVRAFLRQQLRWRRGYIRESTYTLTFAWKTQPILFFELIFWDLTVPFASFAFMLTGLLSIVLHPLFFAQFMLPSWIAYSLLRNFPLVIRARDKIPGLLIFIGFYEFVLYWQYIYALFTLKNKSWITRG